MANSRPNNRAILERLDERSQWQNKKLEDLDAWTKVHTRDHLGITERLDRLGLRVARISAKLAFLVGLLGAIGGIVGSVVVRAFHLM